MRRRFHISKLRVAVVGAGPAGFYTLDALLRAEVPVEIDLIDRLPTPFGLVRASPITSTPGRGAHLRGLAGASEASGAAEVGRDIHLAELRGLYDAVVLTTARRGPPARHAERSSRASMAPPPSLAGANGHPDWQGAGAAAHAARRSWWQRHVALILRSC